MGGAWRVRIITPPPLPGEGPLRPCKVRYAGNESGNSHSPAQTPVGSVILSVGIAT